MRQIIYSALVLFLVGVTGCKKSTQLNTDLEGTWELVSVDGTWSGHQDFLPGNGNTFTFAKDRYSQTIQSTDTAYHYSGTFSLRRGKPCELAAEQNLIEFDDAPNPGIFSLAAGKLTIAAPPECIADGGARTYRKIQD